MSGHSEMPTSSKPLPRWMGTLQLATACGIVLFWVYFFAVENRKPGNDPIYLAFERSFPVPDLLWLTPLLMIGGMSVRRGGPLAAPGTIAAGGAMVFLGLLDASFNVQQSRYTLGVFDGLLNGFINLYCLIAGVTLVWIPARGRGVAPATPAAVPSTQTPPAPRPHVAVGCGCGNLSGRQVAITGGSSGIGLAAARQLASLGAHVVILARDRRRLDEAAKAIDAASAAGAQPCLAIACDVADGQQVAQAFEAMAAAGRLPEILINSAGIPEPGYFDRQPMEVFERQMRINYFGTVQTIQAALPAMKARRSGHIVNISSVAGFLGVFGYSGYTASKFAVWGLSEVLRGELRPHGIAVSVVCPPDTDTPQWHEENKTKPAETKAIAGSIKPMSADAVAGAIVRGIVRRRFHILPGLDTRFLRVVLCLARPFVWWVMDRKVAGVIAGRP